MSLVFDHSASRGVDRLVLLTIADATDDTGRNAWPSLATISRRSGLDRRTVARCIGRLVALGELERESSGGMTGRGGVSNRYRVHVKPGQFATTSPVEVVAQDPHPDDPKQGQPATRGGETLGAEGPEVGAESPRSGGTESPNPSRTVQTHPPIKSQDYNTTPAETDSQAAAPVADEQTIRRTAVLVGRHRANAEVGVGNPGAYAAKITRSILEDADGIDRERITRMLGSGETPEGIASGWATDPFGLPAASEPVLVGPDTAGFYAEREARRREQMAEQVPVDTVDGLAGLRAAREALRKPVAS